MSRHESRLRIIEEAAEVSFGRFEDRNDAGEVLADHLAAYRGFDTLVLGLPRGGVEVADALARRLGADLDVFVSRKIRTPGQPELAAGAIAENGIVLWNTDVVTMLPFRESAWLRERDRSFGELEERAKLYRSVLPRAPIKNRDVIITDDGVATGATLRAAVVAVAAFDPASLVVAVPGGSRASLEELADVEDVEEVVALVAPAPFYSVDQLYHSFPQTSDEEVVRILRRANERRAHHAAASAAA